MTSAERRERRWPGTPFQRRIVLAGAVAGTLLSLLVFLIISGIDNRVTLIERGLPCVNVEVGDDRREISDECKAITRKRVEALSPADACRIVEKAEAQMILTFGASNGKVEDQPILLIDVRCPDESK